MISFRIPLIVSVVLAALLLVAFAVPASSHAAPTKTKVTSVKFKSVQRSPLDASHVEPGYNVSKRPVRCASVDVQVLVRFNKAVSKVTAGTYKDTKFTFRSDASGKTWVGTATGARVCADRAGGKGYANVGFDVTPASGKAFGFFRYNSLVLRAIDSVNK